MSEDFSLADVDGVVGQVRRVRLGSEHHAFVRVLPGNEVGRLVETESLEAERKAAAYLALFLCAEDGTPRYPAPTPEDLDKLARWPAGYMTRTIGEALALNGLHEDHSGN